MLSFACDYIAGAHPEIMKRLAETNLESLPGYGSDHYCLSASLQIKEQFSCPDAQVYFLVGGTQTNQVVIDTMLAPYQGVIAAKTGHVSVHEAGAIEFGGHKVLELPDLDEAGPVSLNKGKLSAQIIEKFVKDFYEDGNHEHMVFPGMVYLSFPTEYGTLYTRKELSDIYEVCQKYEMALYIDGARLGYGLAGRGCDVTMKDLPKLCDVFYIGGTKMGALCGEAVVFTRGNAPRHFMTQMKQHGALLAKGRLLGIQFDTLFAVDETGEEAENAAGNAAENVAGNAAGNAAGNVAGNAAGDSLYMRIGRHAVDMAQRMVKIFRDKGYEFFLESPTNQQYIVLANDRMQELGKFVEFSFWEKLDEDHTVVRFATSWSTTEADLEALEEIL